MREHTFGENYIRKSTRNVFSCAHPLRMTCCLAGQARLEGAAGQRPRGSMGQILVPTIGLPHFTPSPATFAYCRHLCFPILLCAAHELQAKCLCQEGPASSHGEAKAVTMQKCVGLQLGWGSQRFASGNSYLQLIFVLGTAVG